MEQEQYEEIRDFARSLTEKRLQVSDGALLDQCQQHLNTMLEHLADEFEEHPQDNSRPARELEAEPEPEEPHHEAPRHHVAAAATHHSRKGGKKHR